MHLLLGRQNLFKLDLQCKIYYTILFIPWMWLFMSIICHYFFIFYMVVLLHIFYGVYGNCIWIPLSLSFFSLSPVWVASWFLHGNITTHFMVARANILVWFLQKYSYGHHRQNTCGLSEGSLAVSCHFSPGSCGRNLSLFIPTLVRT